MEAAHSGGVGKRKLGLQVVAYDLVEARRPPDGTRPKRKPSVGELCRWYAHPRHWKQVVVTIAIYGLGFLAWSRLMY